MWVPFNEGWGQFDTDRDRGTGQASRSDAAGRRASGWTDRGTGDVHDMHIYPGPAMPQPKKKRAVVLGEFGGLGFPLKAISGRTRATGATAATGPGRPAAAYESLIRNCGP